MLNSNYDVLVKNGTEEFVIIPMKEYQAMRERLEDESDFRAIEASKKRQASSSRYSLTQIKRELGMTGKRKRKVRTA